MAVRRGGEVMKGEKFSKTEMNLFLMYSLQIQDTFSEKK